MEQEIEQHIRAEMELRRDLTSAKNRADRYEVQYYSSLYRLFIFKYSRLSEELERAKSNPSQGMIYQE